jgi:hypothetical protein
VFMFCILVHALVCYSIILIPPNFFLSQVLGITITSLYFYNIFRVLDITEVKKTYLNYSFWIAVIGLVFYFTGITEFLNPTFGNTRLISIFKEPAHYVIAVFPACYYFLKAKQWVRFILIFVSILFAQSSLGFIGIGVLFMLAYLRLSNLKYVLVLLSLLFVAFFYTYQNVELFKMRVDDSTKNLTVLKNGKFEQSTNLSSYVLLSNMYITKLNFTDHPLGSGIGSHHYMYTTKYYKYMRPPEYLKVQDLEFDNSFDANSLATRITSEFGLIGIGLILFGLYWFFRGFKTDDFLLQGICVYVVLKLFRDGTYFPPELFFFVWLFYFLYQKQKSENQENLEKTDS